SNVDREETMMTALGAGGFLTALHTLGRPVLVFHGHKHYPTTRVLHGTRTGEGDVVLLSAGSAGVSERYVLTGRAMEIWPNFNVVRIERHGDEFAVDADLVLFSPPERSRQEIVVRPLLSARSNGPRWVPKAVD